MFKELLFGCCVIAAQKQPLGVFYKKSCFAQFRKFHWKTTVIESLFNKVADLQACNFTKKRLQHRCFPVKFVKFFRTTILKNICERLLLAGELWNYKTSSTWKLPLPRFKFWLKISGAIAVIISPRWRGNTHYGKWWHHEVNTAQKMKFSIQDFFSKCDQIRSFPQISQILVNYLLLFSLFSAQISFRKILLCITQKIGLTKTKYE